MAYHTRTPITDEIDFHAFKNDGVTKGDAYIRYQNRDVRFSYSYSIRANEGYASLSAHDVTNAFKTGKTCVGFILEAQGADAIDRLGSYLAAVKYDIPAFIDWCALLDIDFESYNVKYVDQERQISISKREKKGIETFSPLALSHLKPLKEIPQKWTLSHVRRLLAAGQYSYCGTELRLTDDYAFDAAYNFGKGEGCGESFLKDLTQSPSGWRVSQHNDRYKDGDTLDVWCHTFEKRVITIDLTAPARKSAEVDDASLPTNLTVAVSDDMIKRKPAGILLH
jgi:hypothetical protein